MDFKHVEVDDNFPPVEWMGKAFGQQRFGEIVQALKLMAGAKSILEVGACFGQTTMLMAAVANPGARIRIIDLGVLPNGLFNFRGYDLRPHLHYTINTLSILGFDAKLKLGDSHDPAVIKWAYDQLDYDTYESLYDVVFIDADHEYAAVKADWENYGPLGKLVMFHDIAYGSLGVARLWNEIKGDYRHEQFISEPMGIGVIYR